ncbi:hypothetical protein [Nitrospira sp. Nam74]
MKKLLGAGLVAALAMVGGPAFASDNEGFRALAGLNSVSELSDGQLAAVEGAGYEDSNGNGHAYAYGHDKDIVVRVDQDVTNRSAISLDDVKVTGHSTLTINVTQTATANAFTR